MSLVGHLKHHSADLALATCLSWCLTLNICAGYILEDPFSGQPLAVLAGAALLQVILQLLTVSRRSSRAAAIAGVVLIIPIVVYFRQFHPLANETENSLFLFFLILVAVSVVTFLLSRTRAGSIAAFVIGVLICAGTQFLQYPAPVWSLILFVAAALLLVLYRTYTVFSSGADIKKAAALPYLGQCLVVGVIALVLAGGAFYGVVRPLQPPTAELKLITVLRSMEILQVMGVATTEVILDPEQTSQQTPDEETTAGEENEYNESETEQTAQVPDIRQGLQQINTEIQELWTAIRYDNNLRYLWWLLLLIPMALAAPYVWRSWRRRRWQRQLQESPRETAIVNYYRYFLSCLRKFGVKKPPSATLGEYVAANKTLLQPFNVKDISFAGLTDVYERVVYGAQEVSPAEYSAFEDFYANFRTALRREEGNLRYLLHIFRY